MSQQIWGQMTHGHGRWNSSQQKKGCHIWYPRCSAFFWYKSCICSKHFLVVRSSEVNEGRPEVSHLTSNLLRHILFVMMLSLAFIATCLYSSFTAFFFQNCLKLWKLALLPLVWGFLKSLLSKGWNLKIW